MRTEKRPGNACQRCEVTSVESKRFGIQKKSYAAAFAGLKGHTIEPLQLLHRSFHFWIMIVDIELRHLGACHLSAVGNGNVHFKFGIGGRRPRSPLFSNRCNRSLYRKDHGQTESSSPRHFYRNIGSRRRYPPCTQLCRRFPDTCHKAGDSCQRFNIVTGSRPEGLSLPSKTSASAWPPSSPAYQAYTMASTLLIHRCMSTGLPVLMTTIVCGLTSLTASISSSCIFGS